MNLITRIQEARKQTRADYKAGQDNLKLQRNATDDHYELKTIDEAEMASLVSYPLQLISRFFGKNYWCAEETTFPSN